MESSETTTEDRRQKMRRLLMHDCHEQAETALRALYSVVGALGDGDAEQALGAFQGVPEQVRYIGIILQRLTRPEVTLQPLPLEPEI